MSHTAPAASPVHAVVALAGRRIDAADAILSRFPLANVEHVAARIAAELERVQAVALVCSAACGADLIALDTAAIRRIRRRIVLPFDAHRFAETSVRDRPGEWMASFTRHIDKAVQDGDLVTLPGSGDDERDYLATNAAIIAQASALAGTFVPVAALHAFAVWEGVARPGADTTAAFVSLATQQGLRVTTIPTR
ncbi:hypothetical protein SAMN05216345_11492 [Cupriavidus sp. YR651]|uniref:hypothetical protein n=1 Tax=Cupriavidus sp. YR651 TaxID=1855315 RepID=UPI000880DD63|nr:hypothetical protein [Cupriavidus sp. YR651]SDD73113.1 hypothetical protein SAMN05216345_11492 [Cupriavidus sp. YR651]